ncbi:possible lipoprotein [[Actinomadura] parvosata subsp. kistnae]|uniref:hypothetical protein n=1 Tax=[Actinomadura] parvosata TaxID=1955412 RepID=UPI000D2DC9C0|nr:hypothetical protein [Nonomuraea sp. ATCC 55076]SPL99993.1 possible lipoprotein [Actinomadura parvosata subsp. kistnae]
MPLAVVPIAVAALAAPAHAATHAATRADAPPRVPAGTTAAWVVFDRQAGKIVATRNAHRKYRSASVVKILIAIDYLEGRTSVPAADARLLKVMLRSSDDDAASAFWDRLGKGQIIVRQARRLGLSDTAPPPASKPGFWGYTSLSAYDIVRTYRYLLDRAEPRVRDTILGHLRRSTPCGTDGFDQTFGIPDGVPRPWAVKQGWSGFGTTPPVRCDARTATAASRNTSPAVFSYTSDAKAIGAPISWIAQHATGSGVPDYGRPVLHTTGLVGQGDRYIMAVLTAHPAGGTWSSSVKRTTTLTRDLYRTVTR